MLIIISIAKFCLPSAILIIIIIIMGVVVDVVLAVLTTSLRAKGRNFQFTVPIDHAIESSYYSGHEHVCTNKMRTFVMMILKQSDDCP